ncbi:hypothetical protein [Streptomyces atratus]|uniref:hypothetical protein n=1 Tax=Streptomyces atratus TaxID=1893 RepID=UPI0033E35E34
MVLAMCPLCSNDEDIDVVRTLDDGRRVVKHRCGYEWEHGEPAAPKKPSHSLDDLKTRFPKPEDVEPTWLERAARLKEQYLATKPGFDSEVAAYWAKYQKIFSPDGLRTCDPKLLKDFANSDVGAHPGNQATFNSAWNAMGDTAAGKATRQTIEYLLYGPADVQLEDRLQELLTGTKPFAMTGFKEAPPHQGSLRDARLTGSCRSSSTRRRRAASAKSPGWSTDWICQHPSRSTGHSFGSSSGATTSCTPWSAKASPTSSTPPRSCGGPRTNPEGFGPTSSNTWKQTGTVPGGRPQALTALAADHVLAAAQDGVHEARDGGQTFTERLPISPATGVPGGRLPTGALRRLPGSVPVGHQPR